MSGRVLYFHSLDPNLVVLDWKWFQDVLQRLNEPVNNSIQSSSGRQEQKWKRQDLKKSMNLKDSEFGESVSELIINLISAYNIGFDVSKEEICFDSSFGWKQEAIVPDEWFCYSRLFTFEKKLVPFTFSFKLISHLMYYTKEIVNQKESPYRDYMEGNDPGNNTVDQNNAGYKLNCFRYHDDEVSIKVKLITREPDSDDPKWFFNAQFKTKPKLQVDVSCYNADRCCQIFAKTIDHIESVISYFDETKTGLVFENIKRWTNCREKDCYGVHDMDADLKEYQNDFNQELRTFCSENHPTKVKDLFPDMLLSDVPELMLPPCISEKLMINGDLENGIKGGFGTVYKEDQTLSLCGDNGSEKIAIKVLNKSHASEMKRHIDMRNEALFMSKMADHPYILTFFGMAFKQLPSKNNIIKKSLLMVMELADDGDLEHRIKVKHFDRVLLYRILFQIADALCFMHSLNIYHRDLHPGNVLVFSEKITDDTNVKIADFGVSCHAVPHKRLQSEEVGYKKYRPPELFNYSYSYNESVDIYAFGLNLYYILTQEEPFSTIQQIDLEHYKKWNEKHENTFQSTVRADAICLKNLMKWCKAFDLKDRDINSRSITILLQNPCFQLLQTSVPLTIPVNSSINVGQSNRSQATEYSVPIVISDTDRDAVDFTLNMLMTVNESKKRRVKCSTPGDNARYMAYARNNSHVVIAKQFDDKYCLADVSAACNQNDFCIVNDEDDTVLIPCGECFNGKVEEIQITNCDKLYLLHQENKTPDDSHNDIRKVIKWAKLSNPNSGRVMDETLLQTLKYEKINHLKELNDSNFLKDINRKGDIKSFVVCVDDEFLVVAFARKIAILSLQQESAKNDHDTLELGDNSFEINRIYLHQYSTESNMSGLGDNDAERDSNGSVCDGGESSNTNSNTNKKRSVLVVVGKDCDKITFVPVIFSTDSIYRFDHDHVQNHDLNSGCVDHVQNHDLNSDRYNITAFCSVGDTFWFGTQSGIIYIVGYKQNRNISDDDDGGNNGMGNLFQTVIKPYDSPVKQLVYFAGTNTINDTDGTIIPKGVLSYGDRLNTDAFNFNGQRRNVPRITNSKANLDRTFLEQEIDDVPTHAASDLLLLWQAPTSLELDRFRMERDEGRETNEKLQKIRTHGEFFLIWALIPYLIRCTRTCR